MHVKYILGKTLQKQENKQTSTWTKRYFCYQLPLLHYYCVVGFGGGVCVCVCFQHYKRTVLPLPDVPSGEYSLLSRHSSQTARPTGM